MRVGSVCMLATIPIMLISTLLHNYLFDPGFDQVIDHVKKQFGLFRILYMLCNKVESAAF